MTKQYRKETSGRFKENTEGIEAVCKVVEDMRNKSLKEAALCMLAAERYALEEIANISGFPLEEVKQLKVDRSI